MLASGSWKSILILASHHQLCLISVFLDTIYCGWSDTFSISVEGNDRLGHPNCAFFLLPISYKLTINNNITLQSLLTFMLNYYYTILLLLLYTLPNYITFQSLLTLILTYSHKLSCTSILFYRCIIYIYPTQYINVMSTPHTVIKIIIIFNSNIAQMSLHMYKTL